MGRRRKPKCTKQRYATGAQASEALEALKAKGHGETRFYRCRKCGGFHLTSQPLMRIPKAA